MKYTPKPRERTIKVPSCRTTKAPGHWVQTADGFVRVSDHPIGMEAGTGETRSGSTRRATAWAAGIGKRNFA